ncbi:hypothetical protein FJ208_02300, partial [Candidatus Gribaldobacteria bacterium]|nr:hypothetical protein [Candidatus Gribaldobacteria bacterium]
KGFYVELLIVWILKQSKGGLLLSDIEEVIKELQEAIKQSTNPSFHTYYHRTRPGDSILDFNGTYYSHYPLLEYLCQEGLLEKGMPVYQATEKGKIELSRLESTIADILLGCERANVNKIIDILLQSRKVFGYQKIKYSRVPEPRDPY